MSQFKTWNFGRAYATHTCAALRIATTGFRQPQRHDFTPTVFYRQFSAVNKPVLTVAPGDTIHTTTVDAGGTDANATVTGRHDRSER